MTTLSLLTDLESRLGKATGADRELDAEIAAALHILPDWNELKSKLLHPDKAEFATLGDGSVEVSALCVDNVLRSVHRRYADEFTASLDSAFALKGAVLPGYAIEDMMMWPGEPVSLCLTPTEYKTVKTSKGPLTAHFAAGRRKESTAPTAPTAPLALCLAIVRALIEIEKEKGK